MEEIRPGNYRHCNGWLYRVVVTARHSATSQPRVVDYAVYGYDGV